MRRALTDFQTKMDADLENIEANIKDYLRQAERLFADKSAATDEVRLRLAIACRNSLQEFRGLRNSLLVRRELIEGIMPN